MIPFYDLFDFLWYCLCLNISIEVTCKTLSHSGQKYSLKFFTECLEASDISKVCSSSVNQTNRCVTL